jgi:hypothetical protein
MNHQIVLFNLITAFGVASAVIYLLSLIIDRDSDGSMSLSRHSMGIFTIIAAVLSILFFIEKLLLNESINTILNYQSILFFIILAFYVWETIVYLLSLFTDWKGVVFPSFRHLVGIFTIVITVLSLYLLFTQIPI